MTSEELRIIWQKEESIAQIKGWDFSHIHGRYEEENSLPWDYGKIIRQLLREDMKLLDIKTPTLIQFNDSTAAYLQAG